MTNSTTENTVAVHVLRDHLPCELGELQSSPCPGSMISLCLGRQEGSGQRHSSCCHTSSIILFSNNWLWLPQQTCPPGDHALACSGWQLAWPHRLSAGRPMFRVLPACSLLLQPPRAVGLRRGACCACWSVFYFTSQSMVFSLGKNTEGCFLLVLVGHLSWGWISRRRWWRVIDDDDDGCGDGDNEGKHRPSNPTHILGNTPKNNLFGGLLMEWTFRCHFSWDIDNLN